MGEWVFYVGNQTQNLITIKNRLNIE